MDNMEEKKENLIQVDLRERSWRRRSSITPCPLSCSVRCRTCATSLKPVHRRILYTMYENALWRKRLTESARIPSVPYWAATIRTAMLRFMTRWCVLRRIFPCAICSLTATHFGSVDGDPPAAYRYTEARMSKLSVEMLKDIEKDTVDFSPELR